ncbi:MAG: hypothetical protein FWC41_03885 [Firmicutes bacterium]|nr:hypothetical protein [Bacillota bacterium]
MGSTIGVLGGWAVGHALAKHLKLRGWHYWACVGGGAAILGVVGYYAAPAVFAAIKPLVISAITSDTLIINRLVDWIRVALGIVDSNKLNHIFGKPRHNLSRFLDSFGGNQDKAFYAVQNAINKVALQDGVFTDVAVRVNNYTILVRGKVINGVKHIGTFFIK